MAYIITGSTGHIGNNIARKLINDGYDVILLVRKIDNSIRDLKAKIIVGNIFDKDFLNMNINEGDTIIHLAGVIDIKNNQKEQTLKINYEGTKTILDISVTKKIARFIYFSTVDCIYKEGNELIKEPIKIFPNKFVDNYSYSKALATDYIMEQRIIHQNIKFNILYPSAVIGSNDYKPSYIGKVVLDIIHKKIQFGIKGGYNFIDVEDIALATKEIVDRKIDGDFLLTGTPVTIYEFYDEVNKCLGRNKKTLKVPLFLVYLFMPFVPYLSKFVIKTINENYNYDNSKLRSVLNLNLTTFDKTIEKTVKFFRSKDE